MGVGVLAWDAVGDKRFETGIDQVVLYLLNTENQLYDDGFSWNGVYEVAEKPTGAAQNSSYADNIKYATLLSQEIFGGTIQAFTYPDEWQQCDGYNSPAGGVFVGGQHRAIFGLSYRTKDGDDVGGQDSHYKLHLVYGALASPSEKDYQTVNDSPSPLTFSWDFSCVPVNVTGLKPTSLLVIDSRDVNSAALTDLQNFLYGTVGTAPSLPLPDDVLALFTGSITNITLSPVTFNGAHTVTIPSQTGVTYYMDGVVQASGTVTLTTGQTKVFSAKPNAGYVFNTPVVEEWMFTFVS
jgi:hypothetical protein